LCCNIKFISGGTNIMDMAFKMGSFCELDESEAMMIDGGIINIIAGAGMALIGVAVGAIGVTAGAVISGAGFAAGAPVAGLAIGVPVGAAGLGAGYSIFNAGVNMMRG
jgi:hypothetical protein